MQRQLAEEKDGADRRLEHMRIGLKLLAKLINQPESLNTMFQRAGCIVSVFGSLVSCAEEWAWQKARGGKRTSEREGKSAWLF